MPLIYINIVVAINVLTESVYRILIVTKKIHTKSNIFSQILLVPSPRYVKTYVTPLKTAKYPPHTRYSVYLRIFFFFNVLSQKIRCSITEKISTIARTSIIPIFSPLTLKYNAVLHDLCNFY